MNRDFFLLPCGKVLWDLTEKKVLSTELVNHINFSSRTLQKSLKKNKRIASL